MRILTDKPYIDNLEQIKIVEPQQLIPEELWDRVLSQLNATSDLADKLNVSACISLIDSERLPNPLFTAQTLDKAKIFIHEQIASSRGNWNAQINLFEAIYALQISYRLTLSEMGVSGTNLQNLIQMVVNTALTEKETKFTTAAALEMATNAEMLGIYHNIAQFFPPYYWLENLSAISSYNQQPHMGGNLMERLAFMRILWPQEFVDLATFLPDFVMPTIEEIMVEMLDTRLPHRVVQHLKFIAIVFAQKLEFTDRGIQIKWEPPILPDSESLPQQLIFQS